MISQRPPECSWPAEASAMPLAQLAVAESALVTGHGEHAIWGPAVAVDACTAAALGTSTGPGCLNHASAQLTALLGTQTARRRRPVTAPLRCRRGRMPGSALRVMAVGQHPTRSDRLSDHWHSMVGHRVSRDQLPVAQRLRRSKRQFAAHVGIMIMMMMMMMMMVVRPARRHGLTPSHSTYGMAMVPCGPTVAFKLDDSA
jgi:hypothetical protein